MTAQPATYAEWRAEILKRFAGMQPVGGSEERRVSPSGKYELVVSVYSAGEASWSYSRGVVTEVETRQTVADIIRNYGMFWSAWVVQDGREYLLCGEDYQGYNVLDLTTGLNMLHFAPEAFEGNGYCWAAVHPSPDGRTLAVEGCYWACPYSVVFYDFASPTAEVLPELRRFEEADAAKGWVSPTEFAFTVGEGDEQREMTWRRDEI